MGICGTCKRDIRVCDVCGGLICVPGCVDRIDDGCTCEAGDQFTGELDDDDGEGDEE